MTAICGIWHGDGRPGAGLAAGAMQRALRLYGGWRSGAWDGGDIAIGAELAELLPEDRHDRQPWHGRAGAISLVADVRLDNRPELAEALGLAAGEAGAMADSAIVLAAWERWGAGTLERLCGDYALAVWDAAERRLHLARDPLGYRPLFYHAAPGFFAFASMAKGLHALPGVPLAPDLATLTVHLALAPWHGTASYFEAISRVRPGEHVVRHADGRLTRRFFHDWSRTPDVRFTRDKDYAEAFRAIFDRAVADRIRSVGPIGAQLSGGLDSGAVVATAAPMLARRGERLSAYTHVPSPGAELDLPDRRIANEWPLAAATAASIANIDHVAVVARGQGLLDDIDTHFHCFEYPALNLCNEVWLDAIARRMRDRGERVMLVGTYGNFTISQTGEQRLPELALGGRWASWWREARALHRGGRSVRGLIGASVMPILPDALLDAVRRRYGQMVWRLGDYSALAAEAANGPLLRAALRESGHDLRFRPARSPRAAALAGITRLDLMGLIQKGQLAAYGIDQRDPTADRRVVEFALGLPSHMLLANGQTRRIYHMMFADRVPAAVRAERCKGYQGADWRDRLIASRREIDEELDRGAGGRAADLIDLDGLSRLSAGIDPQRAIDDDVRMAYRLKLLRAVSVAHFIRKVERRN